MGSLRSGDRKNGAAHLFDSPAGFRSEQLLAKGQSVSYCARFFSFLVAWGQHSLDTVLTIQDDSNNPPR